MKKRFLAIMMMAAIAVTTTACGNNSGSKDKGSDNVEPTKQVSETTGSNMKIGMVSDTAGINDQSFNQSAWEGLQLVQKTQVQKSLIVSQLKNLIM